MKHFFVALLLMIGIAGFSQELWNGTTLGMTKEEIMQILPSCTTLAKPVKYTDGVSDLALKNLEILGSKFTVNFIFSDAKLCSVLISPDEKVNLPQLFQKLLGMLRTKYGNEAFLAVDADASVARWILPTKTIELSYLFLKSINFTSFGISYTKPSIEELKKL